MSNARVLVGDLDRDVEDPTWSKDGQDIFFLYDDQRNTSIALASLHGRVRTLGGVLPKLRDEPGDASIPPT